MALAATGSKRVPLVLLARRSVALFERSGDDWAPASTQDLTPLIAPDSRLGRRASGTLEVLAGYDDAELRLRVEAPALGLMSSLELRREGAAFTSAGGMGGAARLTVAPSQSAPQGTPGRALEWRDPGGETVSFRVDAESRLVATPASGETVDPAGPVGELLLVAAADGDEARLLLSSPSLPGKPDRILEFRWLEGRLIAARRSHEFSGRIAAVARIEAGRDLVAVAVIDRPGHTLLHLLSEDELWEAP